jgi:hypothetical protein
MTIKLVGSSSGSVALDAPASTTSGANIEFKLPVADGTAGQVLKTDGSGNLSWVSSGISEVDQWRLSSTLALTGSWAVISANLERADNTFSTHIGTGMSESSGVFTFPSTGKWLIQANGYLYSDSGEMYYGQIRTEMSSDSGSNYTIVGYAVGGCGHQGSGNFNAVELVDVTNASTFRCRFQVRASDATSNQLVGYDAENATSFLFTRLGDT